MTRLDRILRSVLDVLFVALVALVAGVASLATVVPALGHPVITIAGGSMSPAIPLGAAVVEDRVPPTALAVGDVASFRLPSGTIVTHRIVRVGEVPPAGAFETKGDANPSVDPVTLPASALVGRVRFEIPAAGFLIWLLHLPSGILAVATAAAALYLAGRLLEPERVEDPIPAGGTPAVAR